MDFVYCEGLSNAQPETNFFKIRPTTKIVKGCPVRLDSNNYIVIASGTSYSIGVAAEDHPSGDENGIMPVRDTIKVITAPNAVYRAYGNRMSFNATSTEKEFHISSGPINGYYEECMLVLVSKGEGSENTDEIGTVRYVDTSYPDDDKYVISVSGEGSAPHPNDVYALLPIIGSERIESAVYSSIDFDSNGGPFRCVGHDFSTNNVNGVPSCFLKLSHHISQKTNSYY